MKTMFQGPSYLLLKLCYIPAKELIPFFLWGEKRKGEKPMLLSYSPLYQTPEIISGDECTK